MDPNATNQSDPDGEFDTEAALSDISAELFGQGGDDDDKGDEGVGNDLPEGEAPEVSGNDVPLEPQVEVQENSAAVQEVGAPPTWSKDAIADWAAIPEKAKAEILKREQDMFNGIEQYKERADLGTKYDSVVEPYRGMLSANNIDPVDLFQNFAGNHYLLTYGTPEQKLSIATNLLQHYGVDVNAVLGRMGSPAPIDPAISQVQSELAQLRLERDQQAQAAQNAQMNKFQSEVEAFAADPANQYFEEVRGDIAALLRAGVASTLKEAYDKAVGANPVTMQKEIDRRTAAAVAKAESDRKEALEKAKAAKSANISSQNKAKDGTVPVGSMEDTLNETLETIKSRG